jgi:hypothetical protein
MDGIWALALRGFAVFAAEGEGTVAEGDPSAYKSEPPMISRTTGPWH